MIRNKMLALVAAGLTVAATVPALDWNVDNSHSEVSFSVRHFFTPISGRFDDYQATISFDPANPGASSIGAVIQVASVDTDNTDRDGHLRTPDFFDAETYPEIRFQSTAFRQTGENEYVATGDLTIKDVTRQVELPVTLLGVSEVPAQMDEAWGFSQVASFEAELTIDRRDFGVGTGSWGETAVIGGDVTISLKVEANR